MKTKAIYFKVDPELKEKVEQLAKAERRSVASFIHILIDEKLREMENATANRNDTKR